MSDLLTEIDDDNFESLALASDRPVMVDFWAPWCGPCKAIGPVVEALAETYGDRMTFAKCNVDDNPATPGRYGIKSIPTLIFFNGGEAVEVITGMTGRGPLEETINGVLGGQPSTRPFIVQ
jgi:thioredoxin